MSSFNNISRKTISCQSISQLIARHHSTETALLKITNDALSAADRGMVTLLGLLDLSAAFDCVDYDILLQRLDFSFGICSTVLAWLDSCLHKGSHRVYYNG